MDGSNRSSGDRAGLSERGMTALLEPTLQGHTRRVTPAEQRPWALTSQFWVAFFGGVLASTVITYLNGKRLGLPRARLQQIVLVGCVGLVATIAVGYMLTDTDVLSFRTEVLRGVRLSNRIIALVAYLIFYQLQKTADRAYHFYGGDYDSLWKPGIAVVAVCGLLQLVVVGGAVVLLGRL